MEEPMLGDDDLRAVLEKALDKYTKNEGSWAEEWATSDPDVKHAVDAIFERLAAARQSLEAAEKLLSGAPASVPSLYSMRWNDERLTWLATLKEKP